MLSKLRIRLQQKLWAVRSIHRLLNTFNFQQCFEASSTKDEASKYVDNLDYVSLRKWYENERTLNLDSAPITHLREEARSLGIKHYYTLTRQTLIESIKNERNRHSKDFERSSLESKD